VGGSALDAVGGAALDAEAGAALHAVGGAVLDAVVGAALDAVVAASVPRGSSPHAPQHEERGISPLALMLQRGISSLEFCRDGRRVLDNLDGRTIEDTVYWANHPGPITLGQ
jgi:hypothetical protein